MQIHLSDKDIQNIYALTVEDKEIYIDDAVSGKNGYFCLGCKREMQAVKGYIRRPYFRHDVEANKTLGKCTYSDETYRHKLAKDQLQLTKRIKVPPIYKFAPDGSGQAMLVSNSRFVEAHRVANELQFYEDDNGEVKWGRNLGEVRNLLIQPDVTFFDANDNPILFIEIVATHKLTTEKLTKILRLGIDTVTVTIPKDSPESIAETFNQITRTNWIYSNEQQAAEYIRFSEGLTEEIPSLTEEQRRNFKLTIRCRQAEIRDLIFRIRRCLETEHFRAIDERNRRELSRVKENTKELLRDIAGEEATYRQSIDKPETIEIRKNTDARIANQAIVDEHSARYRDLEARYTRKAEEIRGEEKEIDKQLEQSLEAFRGVGEEFEARRRRIEFETERVEKAIDIGTRNVEKLSVASKSLSDNASENESRESKYFEYNKTRAKEAIDGEAEYRKALSERYRDIETSVRAEFAIRRDKLIKSNNGEASKEIPEFTRGIEDFNTCLQQANTLIENQRIITRNRAIREFLITGKFKKWL